MRSLHRLGGTGRHLRAQEDYRRQSLTNHHTKAIKCCQIGLESGSETLFLNYILTTQDAVSVDPHLSVCTAQYKNL